MIIKRSGVIATWQTLWQLQLIRTFRFKDQLALSIFSRVVSSIRMWIHFTPSRSHNQNLFFCWSLIRRMRHEIIATIFPLNSYHEKQHSTGSPHHMSSPSRVEEGPPVSSSFEGFDDFFWLFRVYRTYLLSLLEANDRLKSQNLGYHDVWFGPWPPISPYSPPELTLQAVTDAADQKTIAVPPVRGPSLPSTSLAIATAPIGLSLALDDWQMQSPSFTTVCGHRLSLSTISSPLLPSSGCLGAYLLHTQRRSPNTKNNQSDRLYLNLISPPIIDLQLLTAYKSLVSIRSHFPSKSCPSEYPKIDLFVNSWQWDGERGGRVCSHIS